MPSRMASNSSPTPSPVSGSTRLHRNIAEKQRRDKLNGYISELATIVPMVSMASKRLDKTSILRLSAAYLRISQSSLKSKKSKTLFKWRPDFFSSEQIWEILEAVEGFLLVTTINGKIMFVSNSVEKSLGHQNIEMIGHSVFSFIHPSDTDMVRTQLQNLSLAVGERNGSCGNNRCSFYCRIRERCQPRSEVLTYQFVHIVGQMAETSPGNQGSKDDNEKSLKALAAELSSSSSNHIFKAFVRVIHTNPYNELSLADAIEDEYVTRHSPNGTLVFSDHRIATITGHLPHEVYGMSAYEYIIPDDIPIALFAHKLMFSSDGDGSGLIVYRLRTRNEGFVYLKTTGYLQFKKSSTQVDHFVCVNKQLSHEAGERELKKFIDRFTPHISDNTTTSLLEAITSLQDTTVISSKIKIKNGTNGDVDFPFRAASSGKDDSFSETVLSDQLAAESSQIQMTWATELAYKKHVKEKMCLESENTGQIYANHSPLTESSLSTHSPHSEDTCMLSPNDLDLDSAETILDTHNTSPSNESLSSPVNIQTFQEIMDCEEIPQTVENSGSSFSGEIPISLSTAVKTVYSKMSCNLPSSSVAGSPSMSCNEWNSSALDSIGTNHSEQSTLSNARQQLKKNVKQNNKCSKC